MRCRVLVLCLILAASAGAARGEDRNLAGTGNAALIAQADARSAAARGPDTADSERAAARAELRSTQSERLAELVRALVVIASSGGARPFPLIPR